MFTSIFSLVALLSYFTLISSVSLNARNSWRLSHGLPPARPRRLHSSATETAHRRSTSSIPPMVSGGDFETDTSTSTSPWVASGSAGFFYALSYTSPATTHTGHGLGRLIGTTSISKLTSSITGLTPSSVYTLSYWVKLTSDPASPCTVSALVGGIPVPGASQVFGAIALLNTWVEVTGQFTATAETESIVLQDKCTSQTNFVYVDDVTVAMV